MKEQIEKILEDIKVTYTRDYYTNEPIPEIDYESHNAALELLTALIEAHGIQQYNKAIDDAAEKDDHYNAWLFGDKHLKVSIQESILSLKKPIQ